MAYLAYLQKTIPKDPSGNWTLNNFTNNNIITITAIVEKIVPRIHPVFKRIIRKRLNIKVAKIKPNHFKKEMYVIKLKIIIKTFWLPQSLRYSLEDFAGILARISPLRAVKISYPPAIIKIILNITGKKFGPGSFLSPTIKDGNPNDIIIIKTAITISIIPNQIFVLFPIINPQKSASPLREAEIFLF